MDVLAVRGAAETALEWVRAGKGPILLELKTYRYRGHSMSDPAKYRSREKVQTVREKSDPIEGLKPALLDAGVSEEELNFLEKEIRKMMPDADESVVSHPIPDLCGLFTEGVVDKVWWG